MNKLVTTAIIGTGQQAMVDLSTGTAVDALTKQLTPEQPERTLLLAAGAWALYQQAGYTVQAPRRGGAGPRPQQLAPAEQKAVCSSKVAQIISELLQGRHAVLLPEALERLQQAQQRLPYDLLPQALAYGTKHKELRTALLSVLGERGRWLAQFSPAWSWATSTDAAFMDKPLADIEVLWQEGKLPQRVEVLCYVRTIEPDTAREWIASVWKQEKAETRARLLSALEINLSEKDETFLEQALDDRGKSVCAQAVQLLEAIPTSAFNQRMRERADTLVHYENGLLHINVQGKFDPSWRRDSITQDGKHKNLTAESLFQIISRVSPAHWEERFAASPAKLIEATDTSEETSDGWGVEVVKGWTIAAARYNTYAWFEPLLDWWSKRSDQDCEEYHALFEHLPQERAEQYVLSHLFAGISWIEELIVLPHPWSSSFSRACLQALQQKTAEFANTYYYKAAELMHTIAVALPPDCFDLALADWAFPADLDKVTDPRENNWYAKYWSDQVDTLKSLLRTRKNIQKEII
jgi:hypothetical protein